MKDSKKLQRSRDYFNEKSDRAVSSEVKCRIAEYHFGQMLRDGIVVVEQEVI